MRATSESLLSSFHHVVFMGDLNYRLDYGVSGDFRDGCPSDALAERFQRDLMYVHKKGDYQSLLQKDQLQQTQEAGNAFVDFHEADIQFPPTYKVQLPSDTSKSAALLSFCCSCSTVSLCFRSQGLELRIDNLNISSFLLIMQ